MSDTILTSSKLDSNGRKVILNDTILDVTYYDCTSESWDKNGVSGQSWFTENSSPSDSFDSEQIVSNKWAAINTVPSNLVTQTGGKLALEIHKSGARAAISSDSLWRLEGDFEALLYMDWDSYYNEYRGICDSYITLGYDTENAVRFSFSFNGSGYEFRSLKSDGKDVKYFGWTSNGATFPAANIESAKNFKYLKTVRTSGEISFYINNGSTDIKVGETITESAFANDLYVEIGIETGSYNTYKHYFSKVFFTGSINPPTEFFSENRGPSKPFPNKSIITLDAQSMSIIDEETYTLWSRFLLEQGSPVPDSNSRISATNGALFCTTASGIVAIDFNLDSIYKYVGGNRFIALEPISMRNSSMNYVYDAFSTGTLPSNSFYSVSSSSINGTTYVAAATDTHVVVLKHLASGIAYSSEGTGDLSKISLTPAGTLYWSGYNSSLNTGQLSYKASAAGAVPASGEVEFSRDGYYSSSTIRNVIGERITCFDVVNNNGKDIIAVGSTEGITLISDELESGFIGTATYGVEAADSSPFIDPSFENRIGVSWVPEATGFHKRRYVTSSSDYPGDGTKALKLYMSEPPLNAYYEENSYVGVSQLVNLTGVTSVYFDLYYDNESGASQAWDLEVVVGNEVVKTFTGSSPSLTRLADSFDVSAYEGNNKVMFRIRNVVDTPVTGTVSGRKIYIDNLRTSVGNPDFRVLKHGEVSILEILLQHDSTAKKIYYSTSNGYGAVDLTSNSLEFFHYINGVIPGTSIQSAEFSKDDNEV